MGYIMLIPIFSAGIAGARWARWDTDCGGILFCHHGQWESRGSKLQVGRKMGKTAT